MIAKFRLFLMMLLAALSVSAAENDTIVSLVTVHAGGEIYELEGHTLLRVRTPEGDLGVSYGTFDFDSPNFVYRFVKGETDYFVSCAPWVLLVNEYSAQGRRIVEQRINLDSAEKARLFYLLKENFRPENLVYRYNYVKDNCATRPLMMLDKAIGPDDSIVLSEPDADIQALRSYRDEMRHYHANYPWYQLGIDLALGSGIDYKVSNEEKRFAPVVLEQQMRRAKRLSDGSSIVSDTLIINDVPTDAAVQSPTPWLLTPMAVALALLALTIFVTLKDVRRGKVSRWFDFGFYLILSVIGLILTFLIFVSVHEATSPNYQYFFFNPLCLVPVVLAFSTKMQRVLKMYFIVNLVLICLGVIFCMVFGQIINAALYPVILCDIIRSVSYIYIMKNNKSNKSSNQTAWRRVMAVFALLAVTFSLWGAAPQPQAKTQKGKSTTKTTLVRDQRTPWLVIGISIENLQTEYVELLRERFTELGFNHFYNKGVVLNNVDFGTPLDFAASLAVLNTGASPSINGFPSTRVYNRQTMRPEDVLLSADVLGNYTEETFSPSALAASTLTDELRISGDGVTYAYTIAPRPAPAIVLAGHAGNNAAWLNTKTGNWASSTFYPDFPTSATQRNRLMPLAARLDTMSWSPMYPSSYYPSLPDHITHYPFRYVFQRSNHERFHQFANSPLMNREITDLAISYITSMKLGQHDGTDIINVVYDLSPFVYSRRADNRFELMDAYYRLDADIARLLKAADDAVGMDHVLVYLASTPLSPSYRPDEERWHIPGGEFSTRKAISLLNMYLMARHGNGEWVQGFYNGDFYLNHKLINDNGKNLLDMRREAAEFLSRMAGVYNVHTLDDILAGLAGEHAPALRRNTSARHAGDLRVSILPGWQLIDDANGYVDPKKASVNRAVSPTATFMLWSKDITPRTIHTSVDARAIAPTLSKMLLIRTPNAAVLPALNLK